MVHGPYRRHPSGFTGIGAWNDLARGRVPHRQQPKASCPAPSPASRWSSVRYAHHWPRPGSCLFSGGSRRAGSENAQPGGSRSAAFWVVTKKNRRFCARALDSHTGNGQPARSSSSQRAGSCVGASTEAPDLWVTAEDPLGHRRPRHGKGERSGKASLATYPLASPDFRSIAGWCEAAPRGISRPVENAATWHRAAPFRH
jgi:hypothetical protein